MVVPVVILTALELPPLAPLKLASPAPTENVSPEITVVLPPKLMPPVPLWMVVREVPVVEPMVVE